MDPILKEILDKHAQLILKRSNATHEDVLKEYLDYKLDHEMTHFSDLAGKTYHGGVISEDDEPLTKYEDVVSC